MASRKGPARLASAVLASAALLAALPATAAPEGPPSAASAPAPGLTARSSPAASASPAGPDTLNEALPASSPRPNAVSPAPQPALGNEDEEEDEEPPRRRIRKHPHFKSDLWLPLGSAVMPGFGQYFQGDWTGGIYTGVAVAGFALYLNGLNDLIADDAEGVLEQDPNSVLTSESWAYRKVILGNLAIQGSGFLSAYSAFRISVPRFQQEDGRYLFLGKSESVGELMASPFRFDHLLEPSAFIPLGLLAGGVGYLVSYERSHHRGADWTLSGDDFLFTGAEAWNAGVTEEAVFRGWLYPLAYQYLWQNFWLANGAQALLFGAAHFNPDANPFPWPQALLGFYFGWLTKKNAWTLSESIFVHAWWDMLLFAGEVATTYRDNDPAARASFRVDLPVRW